MHMKNDINITKVTHAGRPYTAKTSRENGACVNDVKALGGWSEGGSYRPCYDRALPVGALLGAAMFNGNRQDSYFVPRSHLGKLLQCHWGSPLILHLQNLPPYFCHSCFLGWRVNSKPSSHGNAAIGTPKMLPSNISSDCSSGSELSSSRMLLYCT